MRVLVTGGAGFIGSHLVDALVARGDRVLVVDDLSGADGSYLPAAAEFVRQDIREAEVADLVASYRPQAICHLAAQMSVSRSVREPLFDASVNLMGGLSLLEAGRRAGSRFVFSSTGGALYGDASVLPTPETYPAWPVSPYGVSKLSFEHYLHCFHVEHGLSFAALRYANVYGPRQNPHGEAGVVAIFCREILAGRAPVVNGDGGQTRDYVYVSDVVEANLLALDCGEVGHFNVGTGLQTSVNELASRLVAELGSPVSPTHGEPRRGEQRTSALDSALAAERLGWKPKVGLAQGLALTARWFSGAESRRPI